MEIEFKEKDKLFDEIASKFFNQNFGTASKSDIDLLMFKFYIEALIQSYEERDGTVDYNSISDYKIARDLGITPQRVRNLKLKKDLVYPQEFDWKKSLKKLLSNERRIRVDNKLIKITIPDPVLFLEIQNYIEEQGGYVDIQLNSKLLTVPVEDFEQLVLLVCSDKEYEVVLAGIKKEYEELKKEGIIKKDNYDKALIISEVIANSTKAITDIAGLFTPTGIATKGLTSIIKAIQGAVK